MKIKVNHDACIGCGACLSVGKDLFEMNEDGLSEVKMEEVPEEKQEAAKEAQESCPTGAIEIE